MMHMEWTEDAAAELPDILDYQKARYGAVRASRIFEGISLKVQSLRNFPEDGKIVPEFPVGTIDSIFDREG
jgi:plasmid stabilization system protein ParE